MLLAMCLRVMGAFCRHYIQFLNAGRRGLMSMQEGTIEVGQLDGAGTTSRSGTNFSAALPQRLTTARLTMNKMGRASLPQLKTKSADNFGLCTWLVEQLGVLPHCLTLKHRCMRAEASAAVPILVALCQAHGLAAQEKVAEQAVGAHPHFLACNTVWGTQLLHLLKDPMVFGTALSLLLMNACRAVCQCTIEEDVVLRMSALLVRESARGCKRVCSMTQQQAADTNNTYRNITQITTPHTTHTLAGSQGTRRDITCKVLHTCTTCIHVQRLMP